MKRTFGNWIMSFSRHWLDDSVPAEQFAAFLEAHPLPPGTEIAVIDADAAQTWLSNLPDGKVLANGKIVPGSGRMLDWLAVHGDAAAKALVNDNLERLLRHVEIKRKEALIPNQETPDIETLWLERYAVVVLFCHQAQRSHDLRFLNAALKLNDWAFPYYQKPVSELRLASYVQALTVQEQAVKELLA
jgi:hypothetical protein